MTRHLELSPAQLCHLLGVESRASGHVTTVLFPRVGVSQTGTTFEELNPEQALAAWRGALFPSCPPDAMFAIGQGAGAPRDDSVALLAARLAAEVPSFSCRVGPDAYGDGTRWLSSSRQGLLLGSQRLGSEAHEARRLPNAASPPLSVTRLDGGGTRSITGARPRGPAPAYQGRDVSRHPALAPAVRGAKRDPLPSRFTHWHATATRSTRMSRGPRHTRLLDRPGRP